MTKRKKERRKKSKQKPVSTEVKTNPVAQCLLSGLMTFWAPELLSSSTALTLWAPALPTALSGSLRSAPTYNWCSSWCSVHCPGISKMLEFLLAPEIAPSPEASSALHDPFNSIAFKLPNQSHMGDSNISSGLAYNSRSSLGPLCTTSSVCWP